ncbi:MAG TPA: ABC transporter ATP-binding protein [Polyangiaceae bacterium]|jgi:NitT/TauT family transport system ATP-binding protein|nr:ABC transporter ATP-binding protein [Polyangiaceae bacterium]
MPALTSQRRGALRLDRVVKAYTSGGASVLAVDGCSFDVAAGEICVVVGPSGCGKSTLLAAIAGFHGIDAGTIHLDDRVLCAPGRQPEVGPDRVVVFQQGALFPWKTNLENVAFGPIVQKRVRRAQAFERAATLLAEAGLADALHAYPGEMSSGARRRVEIARALMMDPAVLLLDEPYRALDALTKSVMHEALLEVHARRPVTVFFITHDLAEAVFLGDQVVIMTARPCRPKHVLRVDIPRPRTRAVLSTPRYEELVGEAAALVSEEARQAFDAGDKEHWA